MPSIEGINLWNIGEGILKQKYSFIWNRWCINITKYYNQDDIIKYIADYTGFQKEDVKQILNSLSEVVREKLSDGENTKVKFFPGLTLSSEFIPIEKSVSNLNEYISSDVLKLSANFSKCFRDDLRQLHNNTI